MDEILTNVALAVARWLTYASVISLLGVAGAQLVEPRLRNAVSVATRVLINREVGRLLLVGAIGWVLACVAVLLAQLHAWFGPRAFASLSPIHVMLAQTGWGTAWSTEYAAAALSVVAAGLAIRWPRVRPPISAAVSLGIVLTVPPTGHAASHGALVGWLHAVHLLGGGLWLGTLAALMTVTRPLWRRESSEPGALRAVLASFTPIALVGAGLVVASGAMLAFEHVRPLTTLFNSAYGQTLAAKVGAVAAIATLGWWNWRRLRPRVDHDGGHGALRRSVRLELVLAFFVVLILTAWLSGLPMPRMGSMRH